MPVRKSAEVFKALGDPTRLAIILILAKKNEASSGEIAKCFTTSWATISRHLNILHKTKLIKVRRESQNVFYYLNNKFTHKWLSKFIKDVNFESINAQFLQKKSKKSQKSDSK